MGGAMLEGWLAGNVDPARFTVVDPQRESVPEGVTLLRDVPADRRFDVVMLGIKPQMLDDLAPQIGLATGPDTVLFSILAGVELASLARRFAARAIVRIMPNLAAGIGRSPIALVGRDDDDALRDAVTRLMAPLGTPEWIESEALFDAVTALAGCGPGFVYRFIDALAAGAAQLGLPADQSQRLALAMAEGAAMLAAQSPDSPATLADRVASPGGSTRAGLDVLDADQALAELLARTLQAARDRNAEMAAAAREA